MKNSADLGGHYPPRPNPPRSADSSYLTQPHSIIAHKQLDYELKISIVSYHTWKSPAHNLIVLE